MTKTAQEIMSKELITVGMNETVLSAYKTMQKHKIRHLPVRDDTGYFVGILSERDIQRCVRFDKDSHSKEQNIELSLDPYLKIVEAMSWPVHKVSDDVPVREIALRMLNEKMSSLLVESSETGRHGIVTTDDMLKLLIFLLDKEPSRLRLSVDSLVEDYVPMWEGSSGKSLKN